MTNILLDVPLPFMSIVMCLPVFQNVLALLSAPSEPVFVKFKQDLKDALTADQGERDDKIREACKQFLTDYEFTEDVRRGMEDQLPRERLLGIRYFMVYTLKIMVDQVKLPDWGTTIEAAVRDIAPLIVMVNEAFKP